MLAIKKNLVLFLLICGLLALLVGFSGKEKKLSFTAGLMEEQPEIAVEQRVAEKTKEKLGIDIREKPEKDVKEKPEKTDLSLNLKYGETKKDDIYYVKGDGCLIANGFEYNFKVNSEASYFKKVSNDQGKDVYYGPIEGKIKNKQGKEEVISIGATFIPDEEGMFSVYIGEIGNEAILFFGKQFVDENTYNLMCEKGW